MKKLQLLYPCFNRINDLSDVNAMETTRIQLQQAQQPLLGDPFDLRLQSAGRNLYKEYCLRSKDKISFQGRILRLLGLKREIKALDCSSLKQRNYKKRMLAIRDSYGDLV